MISSWEAVLKPDRRSPEIKEIQPICEYFDLIFRLKVVKVHHSDKELTTD